MVCLKRGGTGRVHVYMYVVKLYILGAIIIYIFIEVGYICSKQIKSASELNRKHSTSVQKLAHAYMYTQCLVYPLQAMEIF